MRVFVSSVRQGLEEERDAVPALIRALGHEPRRFEDYTAQSVPSRAACLAGAEDADAYLLLLGGRYGEPLPDTGRSPTEEEFTVAKRRGIPILAFRKRGVVLEPEQEGFIQRVEDYATGVFRGAFSNATELLPEVAAAIRELERKPASLSFERLAQVANAPWLVGASRGWSTGTVLETHAIPIPENRLSATVLSNMPARLARAGREHALFPEDAALDTAVREESAQASTRPDRQVPVAGARIASSGTVSVWVALPSDMLGVILDQSDVAGRLARLLRFAADLLPKDGKVAIGVGLSGLGSVSEGSIADLGRRSSASLAGFLRQAEAALVEPRDSVSVGALPGGADEIATELATRLLLRFREVTR